MPLFWKYCNCTLQLYGVMCGVFPLVARDNCTDLRYCGLSWVEGGTVAVCTLSWAVPTPWCDWSNMDAVCSWTVTVAVLLGSDKPSFFHAVGVMESDIVNYKKWSPLRYGHFFIFNQHISFTCCNGDVEKKRKGCHSSCSNCCLEEKVLAKGT